MKKTIVMLACGALFAPLALAQTRSTSTKQTAIITEPITVTGKIITATEEGRRQVISPSEPSLFVRTGRIDLTNMFSKDVVMLWTRREQ